ncbi:6-hydroxymethylpterin diphosphokinase MptE-like protein [Helicobacter sp. NHP22-001]|uniref:motility associated factor glycosyltransferase family protein n=1 Tax=Helicobacter sp. NHP22-001 TaxID=3040202 RepID=UPI00244D9280|nr:6-hydroxymethylpterin diphosphokinase MptE-like protein [Helicobacter sp. NHP22-001]GMB95729.1 PH domain-containing protein [Helicobacter sp. NHP22-001]
MEGLITEERMGACFERNLGFFKAYLPKLYATLLKPPTLYNLLSDPGGVNIINLNDHSLLFACIEGQHQMLSVAKEWAKAPLTNPKWRLDDNQITPLSPLESLPLTNKGCQALLNLSPNIKTYHLGANFYPPTIFYGLAGGLVLALLLEQGAFFHALYLCEEHPDLWRISCYFIDYARLFEATTPNACVLSLGTMQPKVLQHIFISKKITHSFLHLEFDPYKNEDTKAQAQSFYAHKKSALRGWGSFEDEMLGFTNTLKNLKTNPPFLRPKRIKPIDLPICIVGNGPSLDGLLPFLKEHGDKMIIFSCGTALKVLKKAGVSVDFQIEIERIDYLKEVLESAPLEDTPLICGNMLNPKALAYAKEAYMFMRGGSGSAYLDPHLSVEFSAPFVGNAGAALASLFSHTLILCGLDCGYIEGQAKHAKGSYYGTESSFIPPNALEVRSNFGDSKVFSDGLFLLSAKQMEQLFKQGKNQVYNLSSGAFIENTTPLRAQDLKLTGGKKDRAIRRIKNAFKPLKLSPPIEGFNAFKETLAELLNTPISTKKELYALVDRINAFSVKTTQENPFVGILLEGSLAHLCLHLLVACLPLKQADLPVFYAKAKDIILNTIDEMLDAYNAMNTFV